MADRVVTAHIPLELAEEVDDLASTLDRPRGWIVKEALELFVGLEKKRHELTIEALAEVDTGKLVDHSEIAKWVTALPGGRRKKKR